MLDISSGVWYRIPVLHDSASADEGSFSTLALLCVFIFGALVRFFHMLNLIVPCVAIVSAPVYHHGVSNIAVSCPTRRMLSFAIASFILEKVHTCAVFRYSACPHPRRVQLLIFFVKITR